MCTGGFLICVSAPAFGRPFFGGGGMSRRISEACPAALRGLVSQHCGFSFSRRPSRSNYCKLLDPLQRMRVLMSLAKAPRPACGRQAQREVTRLLCLFSWLLCLASCYLLLDTSYLPAFHRGGQDT